MRLILAGDFEVGSRVAENGKLATYEVARVGASPEANNEVERLAEVGSFLVLGNHGAMLAALRQAAKKGAGVVVFDAWLNALPVQAERESFLLKLLDIFPPGKVLLVGAREFSGEELRVVEERQVRQVPMRAIMMNGLESACDGVMEVARSWESCVLCVSLCVLDPAFASVPRPAPGGLSVRELLYLLQRCRKVKGYLAAGVVDAGEALPVAEKLLAELAVR